MKTINDLTLQYKSKNEYRKWYQLWKPRYIDKEITIHDAEITIGDETLDKDGNIIYTVSASPKDIAKSFEKKMNENL